MYIYYKSYFTMNTQYALFPTDQPHINKKKIEISLNVKDPEIHGIEPKIYHHYCFTLLFNKQ